MPGRIAAGGGGCLCLEGEHVPPADLGEDVDLSPAMLLTQVVEARTSLGVRALGAKLGRDEGVEQTSEEVAVAQHGAGIEAERRRRDGGIDEVALRAQGEAAKTVRSPRRHRLDDEHVGEELLVGDGGPAVDPGRAQQRGVGDDPSRVERVGLEVAAQARRIAPLVDVDRVARRELVHVALGAGGDDDRVEHQCLHYQFVS